MTPPVFPAVDSSLPAPDAIIFTCGEVPELADGHDLGSCAFGRAGSSPAFPTLHIRLPWSGIYVVNVNSLSLLAIS